MTLLGHGLLVQGLPIVSSGNMVSNGDLVCKIVGRWDMSKWMGWEPFLCGWRQLQPGWEASHGLGGGADTRQLRKELSWITWILLVKDRHREMSDYLKRFSLRVLLQQGRNCIEKNKGHDQQRTIKEKIHKTNFFKQAGFILHRILRGAYYVLSGFLQIPSKLCFPLHRWISLELWISAPEFRL